MSSLKPDIFDPDFSNSEVFMRIRLMNVVAIILLNSLYGCVAHPTNPASVQNDPSCLKQTGSRIPANSESCTGSGRAYSSEDLNRTGSTTAGGSLRLLDPSLTAH